MHLVLTVDQDLQPQRFAPERLEFLPTQGGPVLVAVLPAFAAILLVCLDQPGTLQRFACCHSSGLGVVRLHLDQRCVFYAHLFVLILSAVFPPCSSTSTNAPVC